ncbi:unnamed protein product [Allacma fusca]|uniref:Uncharacterized protein n=1 Tax=Allacma fusca TaxID=39272 RepID=A0A8J2L907_9HEXA|nr:unnamed protein product [Allacma fusca]
MLLLCWKHSKIRTSPGRFCLLQILHGCVNTSREGIRNCIKAAEYRNMCQALPTCDTVNHSTRTSQFSSKHIPLLTRRSHLGRIKNL